MTTAELQRIAAEILPPVGASAAIAMVDHEPGGQLSNGYPSGVGGRTTFRAGFLVNGRQRVAIGPAFEDGRVARRLVRIINGEPTSRPAPVIPTVAPTGASEETDESDQERTGVPDESGASRLCDGCGQPLPLGARPNRRTHGPACRQAASRKAARHAATEGTGEDADSGTAVVTLSRAPEQLSPGEVLARHVNDVIAASNPAVRPAHSVPESRVALGDSSVRPALLGAPDPTPMTLGLAER